MNVTNRDGQLLVENDACSWKLLEFPRRTHPSPRGHKRWIVRAVCSFKVATYPPRLVELNLGEDDVTEIARVCLGSMEGPSMKLQAPIVHLNGSSAANLIEQHKDAIRAIAAAQDALCSAAPHARDYYVVPGAFELARAQHQERLDRLAAVREELELIARSVQFADRARREASRDR